MSNVLKVIYPAEKAGGNSLLKGLSCCFSLISQYREMQYSQEDPMNMGEKATESGTSAGRKGCLHSP